MLSWGIVLMCNAAVKNKGGLFTTRFLLGVVRVLVKKFADFVKLTNVVTGRGWAVPRCYSTNDLLVSPRRNVLTATLLL